MSEESTTTDLADLLRRATKAVNRRDFDAVMSFYAPDAAFDVSRTLLAEFHGRAAVRGIFEEWVDHYEEFEVEPEALTELGNGVLFSVMRQSGRPRGSTGRVEQRELWVYLFVEGVGPSHDLPLRRHRRGPCCRRTPRAGTGVADVGDGRAVRFRWYNNPDEALEAVELEG
jgi:ketosteroid isomerase-like protein